MLPSCHNALEPREETRMGVPAEVTQDGPTMALQGAEKKRDHSTETQTSNVSFCFSDGKHDKNCPRSPSCVGN